MTAGRLVLLPLLLLLSAWASVCIAGNKEPQPFLVVRPEPVEDPWWLRATLYPKSQTVRNMPIARLQPAWCAAEAFAPSQFGEDLLGSIGGDPLAGGLSFALEAALDGTGRLQSAFVGVYRRCDGERGLFLAITETSRDGWRDKSRLRFLVEAPDAGSAIAAVGLEPDGTLAVWWCAHCDTGHRILYNKETRGFYVAGPATRRIGQ
jgi:hypothetical protein